MQNRQQQRLKLTAEVLDVDHYSPLVHAIRNVLSTDLAETTYAQLVDGLPIVDTVWDMRGSLILRGHPLIGHGKVCEGALERVRFFRANFDVTSLQFDSAVRRCFSATIFEVTNSDKALQSYQNSPVGSRGFKLRLVELVANVVHDIGVLLFQSENKLHSQDHIDSVVCWKREPQWVGEGRRRELEEPLEPRPTLFYHVDYMDHEQYPCGMADVAGYWAEDRIFGGVVVFDRGVLGSEVRGQPLTQA